MRLFDLEIETMLTALGMACVLWLPQPGYAAVDGCASCGEAVGTCETGCGGKWHPFQKGAWRELVFTDCVCPLGTCFPEGMDYHAYLMSQQRGSAALAPAAAPAQPVSSASRPILRSRR